MDRYLFVIFFAELFTTCQSVLVGCDSRLDILFLVDHSNSVIDLSPYGDPEYAWRKQQNFMQSVLENFNISPSDGRASLITFANQPKLVFNFDQHSRFINVQDAIASAPFLGGNTNSAAAMRMVYRSNEIKWNHDNRKIVIAITDGLSNIEESNTEYEASTMKYFGAEVFVVAISSEVDEIMLQKIASQPVSSHILRFDSVDDLNDWQASILAHRICNLPDPVITQQPPSCLPGCAKCRDAYTCERCDVGHYLSYDYNCKACITNCDYCRNALTCDMCQSGWFVDPVTFQCGECEVKADIVFLIDNSGSIRDTNPANQSWDNFILLKRFVNAIIDRLDVGPTRNRIGALSFSSSIEIQFYLDTNHRKDDIKRMINDMPYRGHKTNTSGGIKTMREELFKRDRGDRDGIRNVGILITDGQSNVLANQTQLQADLAKREEVIMFVVGATSMIDIGECKGIASDPDSDHFFESTEIRYLENILNSLIKHVCTNK